MEDFLSSIKTIDPQAAVKRYRKGEVVQHAGNPRASALYVQKGLLRSYLIDSKGIEHIYMFAPEGWIIGDLEAMEYEQPVELFIDCLEDAEVIPFNKDAMFNTSLFPDKIAEHSRLLYRRVGRLQRRVLMLMGTPAIDRYQYFLKIYPQLPNRVPQRMIASSLGIAPQPLSTLRKQMASPD